jgi:hypothetical protein
MIGYPGYSGNSLLKAGIGINQDMLPVFWGLLLAAAVAWLYLSRNLYDTLEKCYPELYASFGKPRIIRRRSYENNRRIIMFLLQRNYEATNDVKLIRLCQGLRYILFIFLFCFAGCLILLSGKLL